MGSWFKSITLTTKLYVAFALISFFVMLVGGFSYYFGQITISEYRKIALKRLPSTIITESLRGIAKDLRSNINRMALSNNSSDELTALSSKILTMDAQYKAAQIEYSALSFESEEKLLFDKTVTLWEQLVLQSKKISDIRMTEVDPQLPKFSELLRGEYRENANLYFESINELAGYHQKQARLNRESAEKSEQTGNYLSFITIGICFLISILAGIYCRKEVATLIVQISESLSHSVEKIGLFSNSVQQISQDLSVTSQRQASAVQETTASVTEISSTLDKTSEGAIQAQRLADLSQTEVDSGKIAIEVLNQAVSQLRTSIFELVEQTNENNKSFDSLVGVISEIESKTNVINEIVFQTKLLSFSASVEAARAGDSGKGFAVVAEEVGNLAKLSGVASKDISSLLSNSIKTVHQIVDTSKQSMNKVIEQIKKQNQEVTDRIRICESAFNGIHSSSLEVHKNMESIKVATGEQTLGMHEINKAMHEISSVTDQNAAHALKTSKTAAELQKQIVELELTIQNLKGGVFVYQNH